MIAWKEAARHYRYLLKLSERLERQLKVQLCREREKRVTLVNMMTDILMDIAYDPDDPNQEYCNVCQRSLIEEDGHQVGCEYVLALAALVEASRSVTD